MVFNSLLSVRTYNKSAKSSRDSAFTLDGSLLFFSPQCVMNVYEL